MKKKAHNILKISQLKIILLLSALFFSDYFLSYAADNVYESHTFSSGFDLTGERLIMATRQLSNGGTLVTAPSSHVTLRAPKIVLGTGFHAQKGSNVIIGPPVFYLNFVVVNAHADFPDHDGITSVDDPTCTPKRDPTRFHCIVREDIDLLLEFFNNNFISEDGVQIVKFKLGGLTSYSELTSANINSPLFNSINNIGYAPGDSGYADVASNFLSCSDSNFCDHNAINVYIYDNNYPGEGNNGHGNNNNHEPVVLVDFERITSIDAGTGMPVGFSRPFLHELGHAFDLGHVCQDDVIIPGFNTNMMFSGPYCRGLTGDCASLYTTLDGNRAGGFAYSSLMNCPESSQNYWSDTYDPTLGCPAAYQDWCDNSLPDHNDGNSANRLSQMEIIYWNSGMMQYTLTPNYPH